MPRWHVTFNITMLRLLSFGMDYRRSLARSGGAGEETGVDGLEGDNVRHEPRFVACRRCRLGLHHACRTKTLTPAYRTKKEGTRTDDDERIRT